MNEHVVMGDRGRITLPAETLKAIGWRPGQALRLTASNGVLLIDAYPAKPRPLRSR